MSRLADWIYFVEEYQNVLEFGHPSTNLYSSKSIKGNYKIFMKEAIDNLSNFLVKIIIEIVHQKDLDSEEKLWKVLELLNKDKEEKFFNNPKNFTYGRCSICDKLNHICSYCLEDRRVNDWKDFE